MSSRRLLCPSNLRPCLLKRRFHWTLDRATLKYRQTTNRCRNIRDWTPRNTHFHRRRKKLTTKRLSLWRWRSRAPGRKCFRAKSLPAWPLSRHFSSAAHEFYKTISTVIWFFSTLAVSMNFVYTTLYYLMFCHLQLWNIRAECLTICFVPSWNGPTPCNSILWRITTPICWTTLTNCGRICASASARRSPEMTWKRGVNCIWYVVGGHISKLND